jgi:acyl-lipid omega-6 desaturase (Delta-12 desaturase)
LLKKSTFAAYEVPDCGRSVIQLLTTTIPLTALWGTMLYALDYGYWLTLLLAVPTAGFLVRLFMVQHDCAHRSFCRSPLANDVLGCVIGLVTLTPHYYWRRLHLLHHTTSGNLDRRGHGDIDTLTVTEYLRLSQPRRFMYRLYRNPIVLFGIGPILYFTVKQRFCLPRLTRGGRERASVYATNAGLLALLTALWWTVGLERFLLVQVPVTFLASSTGVWLFYVQHQFERAYWETEDSWDYGEAALRGSSYYVLPKPLEWLTSHIGLHHIHHLNPHIPNHRLRQCLNENPVLQRATRLTFRQSLRCASLKLWDEGLKELVPYPVRR